MSVIECDETDDEFWQPTVPGSNRPEFPPNPFLHTKKMSFQSEREREIEMDPKLTEISQLFERFKAAFIRNDFDTCSKLLSQLKVLLTEFRSLPPLFEETSNAVHELTLTRYIYEHAVVLSVKIEDQDAFERGFFSVETLLYRCTAIGRLPPSPQEYPILGLNLLRLLVQNRIAEFHTELELLSAGAMENNCIKHAVKLEQSFMEGAYNRVLSARQTVPHETYVYFMDLLAKTVRDEIAGCSEKAYDSLSINDARKILLFSSNKELFEYVKEGTSCMGDKERVCDFPEGKRICTLQGDTISATHQSDTQLCKGVGADSVKYMLLDVVNSTTILWSNFLMLNLCFAEFFPDTRITVCS
ncbi:unnamed protein product [Camellia sinensis]